MKKAVFYSKKEGYVECSLCPHNCKIKKGKSGNCKSRKNIDGELNSLVYGKVTTAAIDPIEKKPLYHFYPGSKILSFGTTGCNLHCKHCQNSATSQVYPDEFPNEDITPEELIEIAKRKGCKSIAATYNEPTIFYEFMLDTFKLAKKEKIKTVAVSNGFINPEPLKELLPYLDAVNIDLKAFNEEFYKKICGAKLRNILETLKTINKSETHLEITNLIIPTLNDKEEDIKKMCGWIKENLSKDVPLHLSAYYPSYKLDIGPTSEKILLKARDIAKRYLDYVYTGNLRTEDGETTSCPECSKVLIKRKGYMILENNIKDSRCKYCSCKIKGFF